MKKLLGIVVLGLLLSGNAYSKNLHGTNDFSLVVRHSGECGGQNYINDLKTSAKYILGNTKININDAYSFDAEQLSINILTAASTTICASHIEIETYHNDSIQNSAGYRYFGRHISYNRSAVQLSGPPSEHKKHILDQVELMLKDFVVEWMEAQK